MITKDPGQIDSRILRDHGRESQSALNRLPVYDHQTARHYLNDTRVLYSEPAKWIARLQGEAAGGPFLLKTEMVARHGGRSGRYDAWHEEAMVLAWIVATAAQT
jgi:protease II